MTDLNPENITVPTENDSKVQTGSVVEDELTVLALLEQIKSDNQQYWSYTLPLAQRCERIIDNEDAKTLYSTISGAGDIWGADLPNASRNYLRNLVLTWAARITEDRQTVKAWPMHNSGVDPSAVEIAQKIIEYQHEVQDIDTLLAEAAYLIQNDSAVGFKVCWNPSGGPKTKPEPEYETIEYVDHMGQPQTQRIPTGGMTPGGEPLGEITWDLVRVHDLATDGSENVEDSKYVAFRRYMDLYEARSLAEAAGADPFDIKNSEPEDTDSGQKEGVEVWEVWHKPSARIPRGLFALVVGDVVVDNRDYPYVHGQLPISVWKAGKKNGHPHGHSNAWDALDSQVSINEAMRLLRRLQRDFGDHTKLLASKEITSKWKTSNQIITVNDHDANKVAKWLAPPHEALEKLTDRVQEEKDAMWEVFGLNEQLSGAGTVKSGTSGKAVAYLKALDSQKMAQPARYLGKALQRCWSQTLQLIQQYVQDERLIEIGGDENQYATMAFRGAEISGVDVKLEPMSGHNRYRGSQVQEHERLSGLGLMDPQRAQDLRASGLSVTTSEAEQRLEMQGQVGQVLEGQQVGLRNDIHPKIAIDEILKAQGQFGETGHMELDGLMQMYQQKLAEMMQGGQPQQKQAKKQSVDQSQMGYNVKPGGTGLQ